MLKETETEETIGFLSHFDHWWHFNPSLPGYAYGSGIIQTGREF